MSDQGGDGYTRRYLLQTLGAGAAAGLAGCSGGGNNGSEPASTPQPENDTETTSTPTPDPEVEHVDLDSWNNYILDASENPGQYVVGSWSPQQIDEAVGTVPLAVSYVDNPHQALNFEPGEVPETFVQLYDGTDKITTAKVNQLPGGIEAEDVKQSLTDNGYTKASEESGFDIYTGDGNIVHAVAEDRHAMAAHIFNAGEDTSEFNQTYLESVLSHREGEPAQEIQELQEALGPKDTFGVVGSESYESVTLSPFVISHSDFPQEYQPEYAATSVDVGDDTKHGAYIFDDESTAAASAGGLQQMGEEYHNGWRNVTQEGRIIKAEGEASLESLIENGGHLDFNRGARAMLINPEI